MNEWTKWLPHVNASLNLLATLLLLLGLYFIKLRKERAHKQVMLSAFGVSVLFLVSYLIYHGFEGSRRFPGDAPAIARMFYYIVLITHVVLAMFVPFLALATIYFGLRNNRPCHLRWSRWTFPIWLYVSITGVVVYVMLYQMYG